MAKRFSVREVLDALEDDDNDLHWSDSDIDCDDDDDFPLNLDDSGVGHNLGSPLDREQNLPDESDQLYDSDNSILYDYDDVVLQSSSDTSGMAQVSTVFLLLLFFMIK